MLAAQMIESHILHLFFLVLPDYLSINRGTDLAHSKPELFAAALEMKKISDEIAEKIGGRPIHPVTTKVGGFHKYPQKKELEDLLEKISQAKDSAQACLDIVAEQNYPELTGGHHYLASLDDNNSYTPINSTEIEDEDNRKFKIADYKDEIKETIVEGSTAKFGSYVGMNGHSPGLMVGALARLSIKPEYLGTDLFEDKIVKKIIKSPNPFHNNIAQAVEVVFFLDEAELILKNLLPDYQEDLHDADPQVKEGRGIGALEAPRGTLYYELHFNDKGLVTFCNIITPTVQNLTSIEDNANLLLSQSSSESPEKKKHLLEMLIRSYDPCITCSVH